MVYFALWWKFDSTYKVEVCVECDLTWDLIIENLHTLQFTPVMFSTLCLDKCKDVYAPAVMIGKSSNKTPKIPLLPFCNPLHPALIPPLGTTVLSLFLQFCFCFFFPPRVPCKWNYMMWLLGSGVFWFHSFHFLCKMNLRITHGLHASAFHSYTL